MKLFDLHCDTLDKLFEDNRNLKNSKGAVTLGNMKAYDKFVRCFAVWLDDKLTESEANERFYKMPLPAPPSPLTVCSGGLWC